jgi:hypothetical protein
MTTLAVAKKRDAWAWRACDAAGWIGLAASPTFALMAWIAATDSPRITVCSLASDMQPIDGMPCMYLLMSLVHVSPWLKLASGRPRQLTHPAPQS